MPKTELHRDSLSAWRALSTIGGLETKERDKDLVGILASKLGTVPEDLEARLPSVPLDQFLQSLLVAIQPFASMYRDILDFFTKAKARSDSPGWRLAIGDDVLDLECFRRFVETWATLKVDMDAPALGTNNAFLMNQVRIEVDADDPTHRYRRPDAAPMGIPDVDRWLAAYDRGDYEPLPKSLSPNFLPPGLRDAALVVQAALHVIREVGLNRQTLREHAGHAYPPSDPEDVYELANMAAMEGDHWLRSHVLQLAHLSKRPVLERLAFGRALEKAYAPLGRKTFFGATDVPSLEAILDLPAWKHRYDAYGVWIATRMVDAWDGHRVRVLHDEGVLRFAFAETRLAEVATASPRVALYSERRSPLVGPVGKSRKAGVQPDYTVWTDGPFEQCRLVVEVKHYKKESKSNFGDALSDYARAHPQADVVLVNYGPCDADYARLRGLDPQRCTTFGYLNPERPAVMAAFRELVREAVGEPVAEPRAIPQERRKQALLIDVSGSMENVLASSWLEDLLATSAYRDLDIYLVDTEFRGQTNRADLSRWLKAHRWGYGTELEETVGQMLAHFEGILVVTDQDGAAEAATLGGVELSLQNSHPDARVFVLGEAFT